MYETIKSKQLFRLFAVLAISVMMSGCELLKIKANDASDSTKNRAVLCANSEQKQYFAQFCKIQSWVEYILETQKLSWPARMKMIQALNDSHVENIQKILLSQGVDTPYKQRLRSQSWIVKVSSDASDTMKLILDDTIFSNSQQLLEYESAILILSRVNARQEKEIEALRLQLENRETEIKTQQQQVEQLLKIEADLSKQNRASENRSKTQVPTNANQNDNNKNKGSN